MNRWKLESVRSGIAQELQEETGKLAGMYSDASTKMEDRQKQKAVVENIEERLQGINAQIAAIDSAAEKSLKKADEKNTKEETYVAAKAALYRSVMTGSPMEGEYRKALVDDDSTGGDKFLPKTVAAQILHEPFVKNPLRGNSTMTNITNLEVPKIAFSLDDDNFIEDGQTAKELKATGSTVTFDRHKFKVFVDVSETVLLGTDTNLVAVVDGGLQSGLAQKEKKVAFNAAPSGDEVHMSFYAKTDGTDFDIATVSGNTIYDAIINALGALEDSYSENAKVAMRKVDYLNMIKELANGSATLYAAQPEMVLGVPVIFCDMATVPVVGDFSYSHYNYDIGMIRDRDKNVKTGMESFVLTAWFDHQIKMKSAFRLAIVEDPENP